MEAPGTGTASGRPAATVGDRVDLPFDAIAARLRAASLPPADEVDEVVAIARGGTVPGALVAFLLNRPLRLLRLAYRDDDNVPAHDAPRVSGDVPDVRGRRIVLVDDVGVSGATLDRARELLGAAATFTLVAKGRPDAADVVLFPDVPSCVRWPWHEDVAGAAGAPSGSDGSERGPRADVPPDRDDGAGAPSSGPRDDGSGGGRAPRAVVVGGVSGSGKTTVGGALARRLGWTYIEADDHHPPTNIAKMRSGRPLDDDDRRPWLASLRRALDAELASGRGVVVSCSALKASYRRALGIDRPEVALVMLDGTRDTIAAYLAARRDHFFDPDLLDSQFADLERPRPDEGALVLPVNEPPDGLVRRIVARLGLRPD